MVSYGETISNIHREHKTLLRYKENTWKKIINAELAITFNEICLRENLLPIYTLNIHGDRAEIHSKRRRWRPSDDERRNLMKNRINALRCKLQELKPLQKELEEKWASTNIDAQTKETIDKLFQGIMLQHKNSVVSANQQKLINLNGGQIKYPRPSCGYINLTKKPLTVDQEELLNMGLNCHVMSKPKKFQKRIECEILIDEVEKLAQKGEVTVEQHFKQEVIAESGKTRGNYNSTIIEQRHKEAAKQLKSDPEITIRRADKASTYVLMNTQEYLGKINNILSDTRKFKKITKNPTEALKTKINKIIAKNNSTSKNIKFEKLSGEYTMGYCYGNVKTHKPGNKLRPIISQIPAPTYKLAKRLCTLLTPFIPTTYSMQSASEFLDILKTNKGKGVIASLDVESLFTNVPVDRTIDLIIDRVYHNDSTPNLDIPENVLRELLECCTKEAPFTCPRGNKYVQIDGVAMGSPLGVLLANFFMGSIEEEIFKETEKPDIYCRYVDDIFIKTKNYDDTEKLRKRLQESSGLNFTIERSINGTMPFLDVLVKQIDESFKTEVYTKTTNPGHCLNGRSECPQRYKDSTIGAYIRRAITHSSTWEQIHQEIERSTQVLVNNGYREKDISRLTKRIIDKWYNNNYNNNSLKEKNDIVIFYRAFYSSAHQEDERIITKIVMDNVKPVDSNKKVKLQIYYKNKKTSHLLLKNSPDIKSEALQKSHVVYKFTCKQGNCEVLHSTYIGMTTTKLTRRITMHLASGAPKNHLRSEHNTIITRKYLEENTEIIDSHQDERRLSILEALYIKDQNPKLNIQAEDLQALPSMKRPKQTSADTLEEEGMETVDSAVIPERERENTERMGPANQRGCDVANDPANQLRRSARLAATKMYK